jgi:RNA polymerase sigma factor (sigma-70 family)
MYAPNHAPAIALLKQSNEYLLQALVASASPLVAEALMLRHEPWARRLIASRARCTSLEPADVEDAQQEALLALGKAIDQYGRARVEAGYLSFRAFAAKVVINSFNDYLRRQRRTEQRLDRSAAAMEGLNSMPDPARAVDPQGVLIDRECQNACLDALSQLEEKDRRLVEQYVAGERLRVVAEDLDDLYLVTKRRWQTLASSLRRQLGHWME